MGGEGLDLGLRTAIVEAARRLYLRGLNSSLSGNVSARSSLKGHFWITPRSRDKASLRIEDLSLVSIERGERVMGGEPSSEYRMHLQIYRARDDVGAVVHTHQVHAMTAHRLGLLRPELVGRSFEARSYLGRIASVPRIEPGTWDLADAVARAFSEDRAVAVVIEDHGVACVGRDVVEALNRAEVLEMEALSLLLLKISGGLG